MPLFDITSGIKAQYRSGAAPEDAYKIMKKIVIDFAKRGYAVKWTEERLPERLAALLTDKDGTDLKADIHIVDEGTTTKCDIHIHGHVFLGGLLGRLVSASTIQGRAQEKIKEMLDENFAGQPSKRAPVAKAAAAPPKPAVPSTLPPGHPAAAKQTPKPPPAAPAPVAAREAPAPAPAPSPVATAPVATAPVAAAPVAATAVTAMPGAPAASLTAKESWQSTLAAALSGANIPSSTLIARACSASAARGMSLPETSGYLPVQIGLVRALAAGRGRPLDETAAVQLLARCGASVQQQGELLSTVKSEGSLPASVAAYALTAAIGEAASRALDDAPPSDDVLSDLFASAWERIMGEKLSVHGTSSLLADKLEQVKEAFEAALLDEAEMWALRERVLSAL